MLGWHHRLNGHEFEQALGVGDGWGSLACCSPWGLKESDMTEQTELRRVVLSLTGTLLRREAWDTEKDISSAFSKQKGHMRTQQEGELKKEVLEEIKSALIVDFGPLEM